MLFRSSDQLLARCSKTNAQKYVNDLLHGLFDGQYLESHSLTGVKSSKGGSVAKESLPDEKVQAIICKLITPSLVNNSCW